VRRRAALPALVLLAALAGLPATALEVPYLTGRVNDHAGMLSEGERERIEGKLAALEVDTGAQVAVLTVESLEGEAIEGYALRVAEAWQLGKRGRDDGVLLLVARQDRELRLEVGYGLEATLPDAVCRRIIDNIIVPRFRQGAFGAGIEEGVDAVAGSISGRDVVPAEAPTGNQDLRNAPWMFRILFLGIFTVVVGTFSLVALVSSGCFAWFLYVFLIPFYATFPPVGLGVPLGFVPLVVWVIGFPIAKAWLARTKAGKAFLTRHPGLAGMAAATRGSGGGGRSGGGFSGGGGSFGGGGASGRW